MYNYNYNNNQKVITKITLLYGTMPSQKHRLRSQTPYRNALFTSYFTSPAGCHTPTCQLLQASPRCPVVETTSLAIFFLSINNPAYCLHHLLPHPDLMHLHLGLDHTKFTQDCPYVCMYVCMYTVVQKNTPTLADYNYDPVQSILIIFSKLFANDIKVVWW